MKLSCLIVDDEPLARAGIKNLLNQQFEITAETDNGNDAIRLAALHQPDIIFLDIELSDRDGFNILRQLPGNPTVILCGESPDLALSALDSIAVDYLLKPFNEIRFHKALFKACVNIINKASRMVSKGKVPTPYLERLTIREPGRLRIVEVSDISWIESAGNYIELHVYPQPKKYLLRDTMTALQQKLDPAEFVRVHRSSIVRKSDIVELRPGDKGDASIILKCGTVLTMSRRYRDNLADLFGHIGN